jgi:hypothetical protein
MGERDDLLGLLLTEPPVTGYTPDDACRVLLLARTLQRRIPSLQAAYKSQSYLLKARIRKALVTAPELVEGLQVMRDEAKARFYNEQAKAMIIDELIPLLEVNYPEVVQTANEAVAHMGPAIVAEYSALLVGLPVIRTTE